jgi:hypothetical protein
VPVGSFVSFVWLYAQLVACWVLACCLHIRVKLRFVTDPSPAGGLEVSIRIINTCLAETVGGSPQQRAYALHAPRCHCTPVYQRSVRCLLVPCCFNLVGWWRVSSISGPYRRRCCCFNSSAQGVPWLRAPLFSLAAPVLLSPVEYCLQHLVGAVCRGCLCYEGTALCCACPVLFPEALGNADAVWERVQTQGVCWGMGMQRCFMLRPQAALTGTVRPSAFVVFGAGSCGRAGLCVLGSHTADQPHSRRLGILMYMYM